MYLSVYMSSTSGTKKLEFKACQNKLGLLGFGDDFFSSRCLSILTVELAWCAGKGCWLIPGSSCYYLLLVKPEHFLSEVWNVVDFVVHVKEICLMFSWTVVSPVLAQCKRASVGWVNVCDPREEKLFDCILIMTINCAMYKDVKFTLASAIIWGWVANTPAIHCKMCYVYPLTIHYLLVKMVL